MHHRRVDVHAYRRDDGLWELEAALVDTKAETFHLRLRGELSPGEPVHDMALRVALDERLVIREVAASMDATPFPDCPGAARAFESLVGMRIAPGWMEMVRERVGGVAGCTHLFELLRPLATTAFQSIYPERRVRSRRPALLDTCHGWRAGGEAIGTLYPEWFRGDS